jgi:hypothetical protein
MYSCAEVGVPGESIGLKGGAADTSTQYCTCADWRLQSNFSALKSPSAAPCLLGCPPSNCARPRGWGISRSKGAETVRRQVLHPTRYRSLLSLLMRATNVASSHIRNYFPTCSFAPAFCSLMLPCLQISILSSARRERRRGGTARTEAQPHHAFPFSGVCKRKRGYRRLYSWSRIVIETKFEIRMGI